MRVCYDQLLCYQLLTCNYALLLLGAKVESISLATGVRYYSVVRACNRAGLCVTTSSDGFLVDISPPIAGIVWDGFSAIDQDFQSYR